MADLSWHTNRQKAGSSRGGQANFSWDSVKNQDFKDRECYIGNSVRVGQMGKLGVFKKDDWWQHGREQQDQDIKDQTQKVQDEKQKLRDYEDQLMNEALGIAKPKLTLQESQSNLAGQQGSGGSSSSNNIVNKQALLNSLNESDNHTDQNEPNNDEGLKVSGLGFGSHTDARLESKKLALFGMSDVLQGFDDNEENQPENAAQPAESVNPQVDPNDPYAAFLGHVGANYQQKTQDNDNPNMLQLGPGSTQQNQSLNQTNDGAVQNQNQNHKRTRRELKKAKKKEKKELKKSKRREKKLKKKEMKKIKKKEKKSKKATSSKTKKGRHSKSDSESDSEESDDSEDSSESDESSVLSDSSAPEGKKK